VHALKYRAEFHVLRDITDLARRASWFASYVYGARLVPVPLHPRKLRERGFNQSLLLAQAFARAGPVLGVDDVLVRHGDTGTQTFLDREARQANVKKAFAVGEGRRLYPGARYVLVDDVFTTGSTLSACAAVLRAAGCAHVDVLTLGHG
jgi:ComF family protein